MIVKSTHVKLIINEQVVINDKFDISMNQGLYMAIDKLGNQSMPDAKTELEAVGSLIESILRRRNSCE